MPYRSQSGNAVIEFLVYILVVISFLMIFIEFFRIARDVNEANKLSNFISIAVSQNPNTREVWSKRKAIYSLLIEHGLVNFNLEIKCLPVRCDSTNNLISVSVTGNSNLLGLKIPIRADKKSSVSRFITN